MPIAQGNWPLENLICSPLLLRIKDSSCWFLVARCSLQFSSSLAVVAYCPNLAAHFAKCADVSKFPVSRLRPPGYGGQAAFRFPLSAFPVSRFPLDHGLRSWASCDLPSCGMLF